MSVYRNTVGLLAVAMIVLGVGIFAVTALHGGGVGLLLGVLFAAAGVGRLLLLRKQGRG